MSEVIILKNNNKNNLIEYLENINEWVGKIFGWLAIIFTIIMLYEVVTRRFFGKPTVWATETSTYVFGVYVMILIGYTLLHDSHVRIDILHSKFSSKTIVILDLIGYIVFFIPFIVGALIGGYKFALQSFMTLERSDSIAGIIIWPVKAAIPIGMLFALLQGILEFIKKINILSVSNKEEK